MNCSILECKEVVGEYREQLSQWQTHQDFYESLTLWCEMVNERTRQFFKNVGKEKNNGGHA